MSAVTDWLARHESEVRKAKGGSAPRAEAVISVTISLRNEGGFPAAKSWMCRRASQDHAVKAATAYAEKNMPQPMIC